jgi:hypothetical protein
MIQDKNFYAKKLNKSIRNGEGQIFLAYGQVVA